MKKKRIINFGEILLRLSPPNYSNLSKTNFFHAYYGGAEANVAASLSIFGHESIFVSAVPLNELGEGALGELRFHGVNPVVKREGNRLGVYYFQEGASEKPGKVVYDRESSSFSKLSRGTIDWQLIFKDADWFHWSGITPSLSQDLADLCEEALVAASNLGLTISVDLNYRPTLWNYGKNPVEVMPDLVKYSDLVLGGMDDSLICMGIDVTQTDTMEVVFDKWMKKYPKIKRIVSTQRYDANASSNMIGAVLWDGYTFLQSKKYKVSHIVDRIGAGDAFMAGIIHGLINWPNDNQKALDFALAASCLKHSIPGDFNLSTAQEVEALMNGASGGRVIR
ncbi:sugar kinase [Flavobacterium flavipallidum]|uniref:Sugar kinase n=1 Tax=Flavobacterium flavipallidum TaxID=3139140 RepID=A0ABU9HJQ0_9FLAO